MDNAPQLEGFRVQPLVAALREERLDGEAKGEGEEAGENGDGSVGSDPLVLRGEPGGGDKPERAGSGIGGIKTKPAGHDTEESADDQDKKGNEGGRKMVKGGGPNQWHGGEADDPVGGVHLGLAGRLESGSEYPNGEGKPQ